MIKPPAILKIGLGLFLIGDRRLLFSCGMFRPVDTFTRVIGSEGEVRLSHPFHPASNSPHSTMD